jgi:hypothetical protein
MTPHTLTRVSRAFAVLIWLVALFHIMLPYARVAMSGGAEALRFQLSWPLLLISASGLLSGGLLPASFGMAVWLCADIAARRPGAFGA